MSEHFTTEVAVRYSDVDTYGHVNNAVYATYCEEARIDYIEHVLGEAGASIGGSIAAEDSGIGPENGETGPENRGTDPEDSMGVVVANLQLDFEQPLPRTDAVEVAVWIPRLGEKSFPFEYEIRSPAGVHVTGETTMVAYDRATREAVRIPDRWREPVAEFEGIPSEPTDPS